jgi:VCBS repeat-containing protein
MKFAICDSTSSETATVTINITPVNDTPHAKNDSTNTLEDVSVTIPVLANDSDAEGTPLTITSTSTTNGTAIISGNNIVFTPATNFNGIVVFTYAVSDGTNSDTARVTVTVVPVNDAPPVANSDTYTSPEDTTLTVPAPGAGILANDTDVDGNTLTAVLVSDVNHGTLALNADGSFTYTPVADYNGPDSFTYRAVDGSATGNVATVTINVTPVSDPLKFTSQQMTTTGFELHVAGDVSAYVISASSNLRDWTPIFTNAAPTGPIVYTDTEAHNYPARFYRADTR